MNISFFTNERHSHRKTRVRKKKRERKWYDELRQMDIHIRARDPASKQANVKSLASKLSWALNFPWD